VSIQGSKKNFLDSGVSVLQNTKGFAGQKGTTGPPGFPGATGDCGGCLIARKLGSGPRGDSGEIGVMVNRLHI